MIGNDVVDLRDPDSDERTHPDRFDERVFSSAEQRLMRASPEAARLRWWLWAAKEAAFKLARKRDDGAIFSPPRYEVERARSGADTGRVTYRPRAGTPQRFDIRWWCADGAVHAVASEAGTHPAADCAQLVHGFRRLLPGELARSNALAGLNELAPLNNSGGASPPRPSRATAGAAWAPSQAVRGFARERIACALAVREDTLEIRSRGRIPLLFLGDRLAAADLSLSHHGEWIAFACSIEPARIARPLCPLEGAGDFRSSVNVSAGRWAS